jgi:hypothetical protein
LGKALSGAVATYNQTVGSLESRVLVSARKLHQMGIVDTGQDTPRLVEETTRALSAPEFTAVAPPVQPTAETGPTEVSGLADSVRELPCEAGADRRNIPPELVMTHLNGSAG